MKNIILIFTTGISDLRVVSYSIADSGGNGDFGREIEIFGRKIAPSPPGRAVVLSSDL